MKLTARKAYGSGIMTNKDHILLIALTRLDSFPFYLYCMLGEWKDKIKFWLSIWQIKFRVQSVNYPPVPVEQPKESKPFATMLVNVSIFCSPFFASTLFIMLFMHFCEYF